MKRIYFSTSITGSRSVDMSFKAGLVEHMKQLGHQVLSEHVVVTDTEAMFALMSKNAGVTIQRREGNEALIRETDMHWVDTADYMVALVDEPSLGVGMEIERALTRSARGLPAIRILCLVQANTYASLSALIKGVKNPFFTLALYTDETDAQKAISVFLAGRQS